MTAGYEIRLRASRDRVCADAFTDLDVQTEGRVLCVRGVMDQAGLHGVLQRARVLRLDLVEVRRSRSAPARTS